MTWTQFDSKQLSDFGSKYDVGTWDTADRLFPDTDRCEWRHRSRACLLEVGCCAWRWVHSPSVQPRWLQPSPLRWSPRSSLGHTYLPLPPHFSWMHHLWLWSSSSFIWSHLRICHTCKVTFSRVPLLNCWGQARWEFITPPQHPLLTPVPSPTMDRGRGLWSNCQHILATQHRVCTTHTWWGSGQATLRYAPWHLCCCSVAKSCPNLCDPIDCSMPGSPVLHYLLELLKLMSTASVMPSNHLSLCLPLILLSSIFPSIKVFSSESAVHIRWPGIVVSASASVLPKNIQGWFLLGVTGLISLLSSTLKSLFQPHDLKASVLWCSGFCMVQLLWPYMTPRKAWLLPSLD